MEVELGHWSGTTKGKVAKGGKNPIWDDSFWDNVVNVLDPPKEGQGGT